MNQEDRREFLVRILHWRNDHQHYDQGNLAVGRLVLLASTKLYRKVPVVRTGQELIWLIAWSANLPDALVTTKWTSPRAAFDNVLRRFRIRDWEFPAENRQHLSALIRDAMRGVCLERFQELLRAMNQNQKLSESFNPS